MSSKSNKITLGKIPPQWPHYPLFTKNVTSGYKPKRAPWRRGISATSLCDLTHCKYVKWFFGKLYERSHFSLSKIIFKSAVLAKLHYFKFYRGGFQKTRAKSTQGNQFVSKMSIFETVFKSNVFCCWLSYKKDFLTFAFKTVDFKEIVIFYDSYQHCHTVLNPKLCSKALFSMHLSSFRYAVVITGCQML